MHIARTASLQSASSTSYTILLVDDQPAVRYGLQLVLALEAEPLSVWEAGSSAEAMAMAKHIRPDVVIMDVDLPDSSGITATHQLLQLLPHCLVIMLTIHNRPEVRSSALAAGAWAFVEKDRPEKMRVTLSNALQFLKG